MIISTKSNSEARMREVIREQVATSMAEFMANMNRGAGGHGADGAGAGGAGADGAGAGGALAGVTRSGGPVVLEPVVLEPVVPDQQRPKLLVIAKEGISEIWQLQLSKSCIELGGMKGIFLLHGIDAANGTHGLEVENVDD
ncbi:hypothetical protein Tco_0199562 [Tanacetum coccineum]